MKTSIAQRIRLLTKFANQNDLKIIKIDYKNNVSERIMLENGETVNVYYINGKVHYLSGDRKKISTFDIQNWPNERIFANEFNYKPLSAKDIISSIASDCVKRETDNEYISIDNQSKIDFTYALKEYFDNNPDILQGMQDFLNTEAT